MDRAMLTSSGSGWTYFPVFPVHTRKLKYVLERHAYTPRLDNEYDLALVTQTE